MESSITSEDLPASFSPFDTLLTGGVIVTGQGMQRLDLAMHNGRIAALAPDLSAAPAKQTISVSGRLILPGVIDIHVHPVYTDNIEQCSRVAAFGGITTLLHFAYARPGEDLVQALEKFLEEGSRSSRLDFSLHGGLFQAEKQVPRILDAMRLGVRSFKFFMTYLKQGWYTDDYQLIKAMDILSTNGGLAMVHAENGGGIDYLEDKYLTGPGASASSFGLSRPAVLEEEAIFRAICLAEVTGCPLYIPHVTAQRALRPIRRARQAGQVVYAETGAHYLSLTEKILAERGALAKVGPPIRSEADRQALWAAVQDNTLQVISSDHAPKFKDPQGDFITQGFGSPQLETLLPVSYDEGVNHGWISPVRLAQVLSENPARIFGLYPQKGALLVGSDADVLVFDPCRSFTIRASNQHSNVGYTLYEGRHVLGWPEMTFQRGRPVLLNGEVVAEPGDGRFLATAPPGQLV
jgi:dihydropyrimidinase